MNRSRRRARRTLLELAVLGCVVGAGASGARASTADQTLGPHQALDPGQAFGSICGAAGGGGALGGAGGALGGSGGALGGAAGALGGAVGGACNPGLGGPGGLASGLPAALGLEAIGSVVLGGAQNVLSNTAGALGRTTGPNLGTTWFSSTYWRMAAVAAVLTLPFLFGAAVQAVIRSDLGLLAAAAFGYLPLAALAIAIAAPLTMLLLVASDELCAFVSAAAGNESSRFLTQAGLYAGGLGVLGGEPFLAFLVGLFTIAVAFAVWVELLLRETAVYVVVLMLPLAFAALVWPARRIWAMRAVELLVALILAKFAIVAVLSLGGAAIAQSFGQHSISGMMAGAVLLMLAAFSPWALLRLVPLAELAGGAAGALRGELHAGGERAKALWGEAGSHADEWAKSTTAGMRRQAEDVDWNPPAAPGPLAELPAGGSGSPDRTGSSQRDGRTDAEPVRGGHPQPAEEEETVREGNWEEPLVLGRENGWPPVQVLAFDDEPPTGGEQGAGGDEPRVAAGNPTEHPEPDGRDEP